MLNILHEKTSAYINGKIITIDAKDTVAEAMLISGDRIIAIGDTKEILEITPTWAEKIDLEGRTVIPGIVDSHVHVELAVSSLELALSIECPKINTIQGLLDAISERVKTMKPGEWLIVRGPNVMDTKLAEGRHVTIEELDKVTPQNPTAVFSACHYTVLNSLAIKEKGWWHEGKLPFPATLARESSTGKLNGLYSEIWDIDQILTPWDDDSIKGAFERGIPKYFTKYGITSVLELSYSMRGIRMFHELINEGKMPLRMKYFFHHPNEIEVDKLIEMGYVKGCGNKWLSFGGIKLFADGVMGHANGFAFDDVKWTQKELDEVIFKAHSADYQILIHTLTPTGIEMAVNAYEAALSRIPKNDHRHRMEHAADRWMRTINGRPFISDDLKSRIKKACIIQVPTPQFIYAFPTRPGVPMRTMMNEGYIIPGASDTTASQPESSNPWHSIWCLIKRENMYGQIRTPGECLTPMEAIRVFTLWGAYGFFDEKIKGSLEPGKLADFCILDRDVLTIETDAIRETKVDVTIVGNEVKYSSGAFKGL
jgi:predicted amidohydrolase YtcJ